MNICTLSGVVIVGSLRVEKMLGYVVFTVRTRNGMLVEEESESEMFVSCVVLNPDGLVIERFKRLKAGSRLEFQGRVEYWEAPATAKRGRTEKRHTAQVIVDANTLTFF